MSGDRVVSEFVEHIPEQLQDGVLYISRRYSLAAHLCCCGCRGEVMTPLSAAEWRLKIERGAMSLSPSIGNWGFACPSHYWIRRNRVDWASPLTDSEIVAVRRRDRADKARHVVEVNAHRNARGPLAVVADRVRQAWRGLVDRFGRLREATLRGGRDLADYCELARLGHRKVAAVWSCAVDCPVDTVRHVRDAIKWVFEVRALPAGSALKGAVVAAIATQPFERPLR